MKIRTLIFAGFMVLLAAGVSLLLWWLIDDLKPQYRKATEEPLVEISRLLAAAAGETSRNGRIDTAAFRRIFDRVDNQHPFSAKIFDFVKTDLDLRVYITDASGIVLFDSYDNENEGKDYSRWNDVYRTLRGEYGTRTSPDPVDPATTVMYVAAPIHIKDRLAGVLTVGKPTKATFLFIERSKQKIIMTGVAAFCFMGVGILLLSALVTTPIQRLTEYARSVRDGKKSPPPSLLTSEVKELGSAFEEMRDALDGKHYIENYVRALTHEIKSPLAAIRGAAELMREDMPPEHRERFLGNIRNEAGRIDSIIEKLLLLSSLETQKTVHSVERIDLRSLLEDIRESMQSLLSQKNLALTIVGDDTYVIDGDPLLICQALANLIQNAAEFSPPGAAITASLAQKDAFVEVTLQDNGPGIPDYAFDKVFNHFYSLQRPETGRKSSGLGLSLVREIMLLHGGSVELNNAPSSGAIAILQFPRPEIQ